MLTLNTIVFSLAIILFLGVKSNNAAVSCTSCPMSIRINLTSDTDINTEGCTLADSELCTLILRIDYTNSNNTFALMDGTQEEILVLTNGDPQVSETTFIWLNELRVQRMAQIICFSGASCGLDLIKKIYRDEFRLFNYTTIQNKLADQLYSSTALSSDLTCSDPSGSSVSCSDGFCRSVFDGNGLISYSSCIKKGLISTPYGLTVTKSTMSDLGGEQSVIIFTCNKPMCNSKENTQQVLQQLAEANIIPQPTTTTTVTGSTTQKNMGNKIFNNEQKLFVFFFLLFPIFKFLN